MRSHQVVVSPAAAGDGAVASIDRETFDQRLAFFQPGIGSALAAALLEEVIAFGCRAFIACGGCGVLEKEIAAGYLLVVSAAVRDEGASYHYLPPARDVVANPQGVKVLVDTLTERGIPHRLTVVPRTGHGCRSPEVWSDVYPN